MPKKTLYLVRHAKSSWKDETLPDRQRPLNKRGHKNAVDMASRLAALKVTADLILSSPAKRALTTAHYFAEELDYDAFDIGIDERLYFCGVKGLLNALRDLSDEVQSVMIFSHNPDLSELLGNLTGDSQREPLTTCTVAKLQCELVSWKDLQNGRAQLLYIETPKGSAQVA